MDCANKTEIAGNDKSKFLIGLSPLPWSLEGRAHLLNAPEAQSQSRESRMPAASPCQPPPASLGKGCSGLAAGIFSQASCSPVFWGKNSWGGGHCTNSAALCPHLHPGPGASWSWSHGFPQPVSGSVPSLRSQWPRKNVLVWYVLPWPAHVTQVLHFTDKYTETR